ncbi:MAG: transcription termination factor NusA [Myxococcaceae bacterium]
MGGAEAVLPLREQIPREVFRPGDRVEAYALDVPRETTGSQVVLSRASVEFVRKLFEREVPEIAEGIVVIRAAAREPGDRTKVAVASGDPDVDPVGACIGARGSRVQGVVRELHGEKVDIVAYEEDPVRWVCAALAPARVASVVVDEGNRAMEVIVPDDQLSLAIGRRGQNVRLAAQLMGWKLNIGSQSRDRAMREFARRSLGVLPGMTPGLIQSLYTHGVRQARDLSQAWPELLAQIPGVDPAAIPALQEAARQQTTIDASELARMEHSPEPEHQEECRA